MVVKASGRASNRRAVSKPSTVHKGRPPISTKPSRIIRKQEDRRLKKNNKISKCSFHNNTKGLLSYKVILQSFNSREEDLIEATRGIRELSSAEGNCHCDEIVKAGIVPLLINLLNGNIDRTSIVIYESAWALANISSTDYTEAIAIGGGIKAFVSLLHHDDTRVRESSALCLGNIASIGLEWRNQVVKESPVDALMSSFQNSDKDGQHLETIMFTISVLCRGDPGPLANRRNIIVSTLTRTLENIVTEPIHVGIMTYVLKAISYLSNGDARQSEFVCTPGIMKRLFDLLGDDSSFKKPIIDTVVHFLSVGSRFYSRSQLVLDSGVLDHLPALLRSPSKVIRKGSSKIVSKITCGNRAQISRLVRQKNVLDILVLNATNDIWNVRKDAIRALANICIKGDRLHILTLVRADGFRPLIAILGMENANVTVLIAVLDAVKNVLHVCNESRILFEENNGPSCIEELQNHPNDIVYAKACTIIENYLGQEEPVDENVNVASEIVKSGHFAFAASCSPIKAPLRETYG